MKKGRNGKLNDKCVHECDWNKEMDDEMVECRRNV